MPTRSQYRAPFFVLGSPDSKLSRGILIRSDSQCRVDSAVRTRFCPCGGMIAYRLCDVSGASLDRQIDRLDRRLDQAVADLRGDLKILTHKVVGIGQPGDQDRGAAQHSAEIKKFNAISRTSPTTPAPPRRPPDTTARYLIRRHAASSGAPRTDSAAIRKAYSGAGRGHVRRLRDLTAPQRVMIPEQPSASRHSRSGVLVLSSYRG